MERECEKCKQTTFCFADEPGHLLCLNCSGVEEALTRQGICSGTEDYTNKNQLQLPLEQSV